MNRKAEKLLQRLRNSKAQWTPQEYHALLTGMDFDVIRETRHGTLYEHRRYSQCTVIIPRHRRLKPWVADDVLDMVECVQQALRDREARDDAQNA